VEDTSALFCSLRGCCHSDAGRGLVENFGFVRFWYEADEENAQMTIRDAEIELQGREVGTLDDVLRSKNILSRKLNATGSKFRRDPAFSEAFARSSEYLGKLAVRLLHDYKTND
jgi:hypothetical protein